MPDEVERLRKQNAGLQRQVDRLQAEIQSVVASRDRVTAALREKDETGRFTELEAALRAELTKSKGIRQAFEDLTPAINLLTEHFEMEEGTEEDLGDRMLEVLERVMAVKSKTMADEEREKTASKLQALQEKANRARQDLVELKKKLRDLAEG